jgi:hypothetical protein
MDRFASAIQMVRHEPAFAVSKASKKHEYQHDDKNGS